MAQEDESEVRLPGAPPPSPAKREAAIETALRRFDAAHGRGTIDKDAGAPVVGRTPRRSRIRAPQIGLLVSVALIAVIGLPTIRKIMDERPMAPQSAPGAPGAAVEPPALPPPSKPADNSPKQSAAPMASAPSTPSTPTPRLEEDSPSQDRPGVAAEAERAIQRAPVLPVIAAAPPSPASPPPPPPSAPVMAEKAGRSASFASPAMSEDSASGIIVTARRRTSSARAAPDRGDWNACTVNDPARNLDKCGRTIGRGGKGAKADSATHVADGLTLAWRGEDAAAITAFDQAIAISPKSAIAYLNRGLSYQRQGDLDRAIADLDQAARYNSGSASILYNRSLLLRQRGQKGDSGKADADQRRALSIDPDYDAVLE